MQIILLEQVKNLGNIGEVVKVKDGFARNFLLPNNKALRASKANIDLFEAKKAEINKKNQELIKEAQSIAKKVDNIVVDIVSQAGEDGRLYGSVNITDIANAVSKKSGLTVERKLVALHDPIKYIGVHSVDIDLHAEVGVKVNVNVARTADEAKATAAKFAKGEDVAPKAANDEDKEKAKEVAKEDKSAETSEDKSDAKASEEADSKAKDGAEEAA